jgi:hypothetical protein
MSVGGKSGRMMITSAIALGENLKVTRTKKQAHRGGPEIITFAPIFRLLQKPL